MCHDIVNGTLGSMDTFHWKIFIINEKFSRKERDIHSGTGMPLCCPYHDDSYVSMAMVQRVVFQVPRLLLCVYLPLLVVGSREGGRLFKYQLEPPFWICLDGHI
jgi:hypothetical protein